MPRSKEPRSLVDEVHRALLAGQIRRTTELLLAGRSAGVADAAG